MSFWDLSDGGTATETGTEFDGGGGGFEIIPDKSSVLAIIDEAAWDEDRSGNEIIKLRWSVVKPEQYANAKVFQKLYVTDLDTNPKTKNPQQKRDKARKMLGAIDANCGGKLGRKSGKPSDEDLAMALLNKPCVIRVHVWEMEGDNGPMSGNWVAAVSPKNAEVKLGDGPAPAKAKNGGPARPVGEKGWTIEDDLEDEIPF